MFAMVAFLARSAASVSAFRAVIVVWYTSVSRESMPGVAMLAPFGVLSLRPALAQPLYHRSSCLSRWAPSRLPPT